MFTSAFRASAVGSQKFHTIIFKNLIYLSIISYISLYLLYDLDIYYETYIKNYRIKVPFQNIPKTMHKNDSIKYILFWNSWYRFPDWYMGAKLQGEDYLKSIDCPVTNCLFIHNRKFLPKPTDYDALVFHVGNPINPGDLPDFRREDQIYIMANEESPLYVKHNLKLEENFFNMTLTYRLDSDVFWNYGVFIDKETGSVVAPSKFVKWREPEVVDDPDLLKFIITSKTKLAAWFLSHCGAKSYRDNLGTNMQQLMPVDVYGYCGNLTCPLSTDIYNSAGRQQCTDMLNSTYKFYLSFENSICTDYMTEKVYLNMENYIVPILYNGITDMQHFLPPHSYIHVNDSSSVKDLVNNLKYLDKNPQEYANYFWWKKYYKVTENVHKYSYCDMCQKINSWNVKKKRKEYLDVADWFGRKSCYKMGSEF